MLLCAVVALELAAQGLAGEAPLLLVFTTVVLLVCTAVALPGYRSPIFFCVCGLTLPHRRNNAPLGRTPAATDKESCFNLAKHKTNS